MSNIRAITGSSKIVYRNQGGGSKKQGIPSTTNLNTTAHVAFRNRNVVCACNRHVVFCMNQLGGVGAGGVPGNSYAFAPGADGVNKNKILRGMNHKNIKHPSQFELIYKSSVDFSQISHEDHIYKMSPSTIGYILFNNYIVVRRITTLQYNFLNSSTRFHLINDNGNKNPNDLIDNEYIILGYYYRDKKFNA